MVIGGEENIKLGGMNSFVSIYLLILKYLMTYLGFPESSFCFSVSLIKNCRENISFYLTLARCQIGLFLCASRFAFVVIIVELGIFQSQELERSKLGHSDERTIYEVRISVSVIPYVFKDSLKVEMIWCLSRCSKEESQLM